MARFAAFRIMIGMALARLRVHWDREGAELSAQPPRGTASLRLECGRWLAFVDSQQFRTRVAGNKRLPQNE